MGAGLRGTSPVWRGGAGRSDPELGKRRMRERTGGEDDAGGRVEGRGPGKGTEQKFGERVSAGSWTKRLGWGTQGPAVGDRREERAGKARKLDPGAGGFRRQQLEQRVAPVPARFAEMLCSSPTPEKRRTASRRPSSESSGAPPLPPA